MIFSLEKKPFLFFKALTVAVLALVFFCFLGSKVYAQESLSLSVTPPLFQLSVEPGQTWNSSVKMVNSNPYNLTVYASVVNFQAQGDVGTGKFIPLSEEERRSRSILASWIDVDDEAFHIPAGESADIPISVRVPTDAPPGGHYAAILVGTRPVEEETAEGSRVRVSSMVTSLFFLRVEGEVIERGVIREFSTDQFLYQEPKANLLLNFQNTGNVHLRPTGQIVIYNMWGKERGRIEVNRGNHFGNVLPESSRSFRFNWQGERNIFESGRYKAVVSLSYGEDSRKSEIREITFWVVPVIPVVGALISIILAFLFLAWSIRAYVRRALALERRRVFGDFPPETLKETARKDLDKKINVKALVTPMTEGVVDMRAVSFQKSKASLNREKGLTIKEFIFKYKMFFIFVVVFLALFIIATLYFTEVLVSEREFQSSVIREEVY